MTLWYGVYGLRLTATERIPFLQPPAEASGAPDVTAAFADGVPPGLCDAEPWHRGWEPSGQPPEFVAYCDPTVPRFRFCYDVGTTFDYEPDSGRLTAYWSDPQTFEDTCTYLVGPILGFVLHLRRRLCLHAGVAAIGDSAVALVGPNGIGKSTLLAALLARGAQVVTEDVAAVEQRDGLMRVHFGPRAIRLWSPSVAALYGCADALPPISKHWEKQYLPLDAPEGEWERGVPLTAVYLLEVGAPDAPVVGEPLPPATAVGRLLANIYPARLPLPDVQSVMLDDLIRLVSALPVIRLCLPNDFNRLQDVCDYLLARHDRRAAV